jgi:hypothetical protein
MAGFPYGVMGYGRNVKENLSFPMGRCTLPHTNAAFGFPNPAAFCASVA